MRLYSEIELNEQLDRLHLSPKQKDNVRGLISSITEKYSDQIEKMKCCLNCKHQTLKTKDDFLFCCECKQLDEQKEKIILTKWGLKNE